MMKDLEKMMGKKSGEKLSPDEMQAKMDVLKELLQMAQEAMGAKVKGGMDELQKVSVMAPDKESLAKGLDLAKDVTASPELSADENAEEASETPEEKKAEELDPTLEAKEEASEGKEDDEDEDSLFGKPKSSRNKISSMLMGD